MQHSSPAHAGIWCARNASGDCSVLIGDRLSYRMVWIVGLAWLVSAAEYAEWQGELERAEIFAPVHDLVGSDLVDFACRIVNNYWRVK